MKINTEILRALQENEVRQKSGTPAEGFDTLLAEQLGSGQAQGVTPGMDAQRSVLYGNALPVSLDPLAGNAETIDPSSLLEAPGREAATRMQGLLDGFDAYAAQIASNNETALRDAYSLLEGMTGQIAAMRADFPEMDRNDPAMSAMVNELETLAVTETFKFNRGDYL